MRAWQFCNSLLQNNIIVIAVRCGESSTFLLGESTTAKPPPLMPHSLRYKILSPIKATNQKI